MIFTLKTDNKEIPLVEPFVNGNFLYRKLNFNIREKNQEFWYDQVIIPPDKFNYDGIVNVIISEKYPSDKMQAIINNYLLEPELNKDEFDEMQTYRKQAKKYAKLILEYKQN